MPVTAADFARNRADEHARKEALLAELHGLNAKLDDQVRHTIETPPLDDASQLRQRVNSERFWNAMQGFHQINGSSNVA